jgi:NtrC-family two-component system response regulator AlgB
METPTPKVIVVDDEANILKTVGICFKSLGFDAQLFTNPVEALQKIHTEKFDLAFIDLKMIPLDGLEMLAEIKRISPDTTVTIITAHGTIESAVEAIKKGAYHYLQKPFNYTELQIFAQKTWEYHQLATEVKELRQIITPDEHGVKFITRNAKTREILDLAERMADSNLTILIEGESGTGKELIAQLIHDKSSRVNKPLVKINCAALPTDLLESELFGHVKGSFTGAVQDRVGRFEIADGGTIFLDEIAEISMNIQVKLLRILQTKEFERVGESVTRKVDVRILAATNRNLDEALREGIFRDDLFYRLNAVRLKLLPLRNRPEDILLLIQHFLYKHDPTNSIDIAPESMRLFRLYPWPGNVREIENVIQRAVLLAQKGTLEPQHLPEEISRLAESPKPIPSLEEMEKHHIQRVLTQTKDFNEAAQILGIDIATLWRKRKKYSI